jgi:PAS domain S-box-containing protein
MELNQIYKAILEVMKEAAYFCDPQMNLLYMNPAAEDLSGCFDDCMEKNSAMVFGHSCIEASSSAASAGRPVVHQVSVAGKNGFIQVRRFISAVLDDKDVLGFIVVMEHPRPLPLEQAVEENATAIKLPFPLDHVESQMRCKAALEGVSEAIFFFDPVSKHVLEVNPAFKKLIGYGQEELPRLSIYDFIDHPKDQIDSELDPVIIGGHHIVAEQEFKRKDGSDVYVEVSLSLIGSAGRKVVFALVRDVSSRKKAEEEIKNRDRLLAGVAVATSQLLTSVGYDDALTQVVEVLGFAADVDRVYIYENRDTASGEQLAVLRYKWGRVEDVSIDDIIYYERLPRWYARLSADKPIHGLTEDLPTGEREYLSNSGVVSVLVFPINIDGLFWGFIGFDDCRRERVWSWSDVSILMAVAGSIGGAVARQKTEAELIESEEKYRQLVENANSIIIRIDMDGRITFINEFGAAFFGVGENELIGKSANGTVLPTKESSGRDLSGLVTELLTNPDRYVTHVNENIKSSGERVWIAWTNRPILDDDGRMVELLCIGNDITERKEWEEQLKQANQRLLDTIDFLPDPTFVIDADHKVVAWNRAMEELTGIEKTEIKGKGDYAYSVPFYGKPRPMLIDIVGSPSAEDTASYTEIERKGNNLFSRVTLPLDALGKRRYLRAKASPLFDREGKMMGAIETIRDITDEMLAREELVKKDHLLAGVSMATSGLLASNNIQSAIKEAIGILGLVAEVDRICIYENIDSRQALRRFEWFWEDQEASGGKDRNESISYDAQIPMWYERLSSGAPIVGMVAEMQEPQRSLFKSRGSELILSVPIHVDGAFWGFLCFENHFATRNWTKTEISIIQASAATIGEAIKRKRVDEQLRLLESAVVNANDGIMIATPDPVSLRPVISYINKAFTKMTGYGSDEAMGKNPSFFIASNASAEVGNDDDLLFSKEQTSCERLAYRKNAMEFWIEINVVPVFDDRNRLTHWISTQRDTSERHRSEEMLRWNDTLIRSMAENTPLGFYVVEALGKSILYSNHRFFEIWGIEDLEREVAKSSADSNDVTQKLCSFAVDAAACSKGMGPEALDSKDTMEDEMRLLDGRTIRRFTAPVTDPAGRQLWRLYIFEDITSRKKEEQELRETRNYLESLINNANAPIAVWDQQFLITKFNHAFERLTGYLADEVLGRRLDLLFPDESRDESIEKIERTLSGEKWEWVEIPIRRKDGIIRHVLWNSANIYSDDGRTLAATIAQGTDITDRKEAEEQAYFQASLLSQVRNAVITTDLQGRITYLNKFAELMYGWKVEEIIGKSLIETIIPQDRLAQSSDVMDRIMQEGHFEGEFPVLRKDGSEFPAYYSFSVLTEPVGTPLGFLGVSVDMTDRMRSIEELKAAKVAAEVAAKAKSDFLANMSHEIRTPLNAVIGMTGLLLGMPLSIDQRDYVETIRRSGDALLEIISDILDFSKIEGGKLELEQQPFDLKEGVEASIDLVATKASEKGLELAYEIDPAVPAVMLGDVTRLRQVLVNLLSNAVKFTEKGEVKVKITSSPINETEHEVHFEVSDTGIGISPDQQSRLFQSFSQVDTSITRKYGGTGLGLAISKHLVELMGGRIWVESDFGKGSTFHFSLTAKSLPIEAGTAAVPETEGRSVLVVTDGLGPFKELIQLAESLGLQAKSAAAEEALDLLGRVRYEAVVLDGGMNHPKLDQIEAAIAKLDHDQRPGILLLISGNRAPLRLGKFVPIESIDGELNSQSLQSALKKLFSRRQRFAENYDATFAKMEDVAEKNLRILIAEDNAVNQKVALRMLERLGFRADIAANGIEVLQALDMRPYDVILMDVQMPEMDGLEASRRIRQQFPTSGPYIIATTAYALKGDKERCLSAGMNDYISKPIQMQELAAAIRKSRKQVRSIDSEVIEQLKAQQVEGEPDIVKELSELFIGYVPSRIAHMKRAAESGDVESLCRSARGMRISAAKMGASVLAGICKDLEKMGQTGCLEGADLKIEELRAEYLRVEKALAELIGAGGGQKKTYTKK